MRRDLGDFQTPDDLVDEMLRALGAAGGRWARVLEPTCGSGSFIAGLLRLPSPPREIVGLEIQEPHLAAARERCRPPPGTSLDLRRADIFRLDLGRDIRWRSGGPLLVVGNPPWVTNAELGALGSSNLPEKTNLKRLRGIDALTGESNFDIAEAIWLKLIRDLAGESPSIALLAKTSVARNVLAECERAAVPIARAWLRRIDSRRRFGAAVDAGLFYLEIGPPAAGYRAPVYPDLAAGKPEAVMAVAGGRFIADLDAHERSSFADGICPLEWRQGLKHDAAAVLELSRSPAGLANGLGEPVDIEPDRVYPLLKGSDLFRSDRPVPTKYVIVPQRRIGEDTLALEREAPRLWAYLAAHRAALDARKSSIYRGRPPFAVFGVGDYTFAPYKVAVAGLFKEPRFRAVGPHRGRPVLLDDTCYFLPARSAEQAAFLAALLDLPAARDLLAAISARDAKRPVTKKVLARIDLEAILARADRAALLAAAGVRFRGLVEPGEDRRPAWPPALDSLLAP